MVKIRHFYLDGAKFAGHADAAIAETEAGEALPDVAITFKDTGIDRRSVQQLVRVGTSALDGKIAIRHVHGYGYSSSGPPGPISGSFSLKLSKDGFEDVTLHRTVVIHQDGEPVVIPVRVRMRRKTL